MSARPRLPSVSPTRRTLLGRTALALSGGALASLAGCLGGPAATAADSGSETSTPPAESSPATASPATSDGESWSPPPPAFTRWLPSPAQSPYRNGYGVSYVDMAAVRERRDALHEIAVERLEREFQHVLPAAQYVDVEDVDAAFRFAFSTSVALGSFDPSAFGERYRDEQRSRAVARTGTPATETATPTQNPEEYGGFTLYGRRRVYAVSENALVSVGGFAEGDLREYARAVIDARADDVSRYTDANAYADALFGLVGTPHRLTCYVEAMDGSTSRGFREDVITGGLRSWQFGPETTRLTYANTYPDEEAAGEASFESHIENESARFGTYDGLDARRDGRLIWTEGTLPTREFDFLSAGGPAEGVYTPNG